MMDKERFQSLAASYGGFIPRWPASERVAAIWFIFRCSRSSQKILGDARRLDQMLNRSSNPRMTRELYGSLIESAIGLGGIAGRGDSWFGAVLGAGLATACAAGIATGLVIGPLNSEPLTAPLDPAEVAAGALGNPIEFGDG
jgi:hypothetical protein